LEFTFATKDIRDICERKEVAQKELGQDVALVLCHRLADLGAASNLADFPVEKNQISSEEYKINLTQGFILRFCINQNDKAYKSESSIDDKKVYRISIMYIGEDND